MINNLTSKITSKIIYDNIEQSASEIKDDFELDTKQIINKNINDIFNSSFNIWCERMELSFKSLHYKYNNSNNF